jgi:toxin ParE1/3/4
VAEKPRLQLHVTGPARRDIASILKRTIQEFGEPAARRYTALIRQALIDLQADPERPGSKQRPDIMIEGARTYHISFSRKRVSGSPVKDPRHFVLYRRRDDGVIQIARILHDSRDLQRHIPQDYRSGTRP